MKLILGDKVITRHDQLPIGVILSDQDIINIVAMGLERKRVYTILSSEWSDVEREKWLQKVAPGFDHVNQLMLDDGGD